MLLAAAASGLSGAGALAAAWAGARALVAARAGGDDARVRAGPLLCLARVRAALLALALRRAQRGLGDPARNSVAFYRLHPRQHVAPPRRRLRTAGRASAMLDKQSGLPLCLRAADGATRRAPC